MINVDIVNEIAVKAGEISLKYHKNITEFSLKEDGSKITIADIEVNDFICKSLKKHYPEIAIISEENDFQSNYIAFKNKSYFLIDPIDGTKNFIKGGDEFTINIAFIENFQAVFGAIYVPVKKILYYTKNNKSYKKVDFVENQIFVSNKNSDLTMIIGARKEEKNMVENWVKKNNLEISQYKYMSSSYKFCLVAEGFVDVYLKMANIKIWDIAAGDAILKYAGGKIIDIENNKEISYLSFEAPKFLACNDKIII